MKEFEKVIGYEDVKMELERICDLLVNTQKYSMLGVTPPGGLLLHGEPGVGKTTMAKCFIQACGRKTFTCRKLKPDGEFVNEIKATFDEAATNAPSIVFLDDMDKFANDDRYHRNSEEFVAVQSCIDEVKGKDVFVLATANDLDNLPDSLLRAGRFDKVIAVKNPTGKDAVEIIRYYLGRKNYLAEIDTEEVARILDGRSCAELETVVNEAGIYAGFEGKEKITMDDIVRACMRIIYKAPETLSPAEDEFLEQTAYHEAGHAVVAEVLEEGSVSLVSVCEHGREIGGITAYYQPDRYFHAKKYMENRVLAVLAGKAATEVKYGETDVGANSDLHRAFDIVTRFIDNYCSYGFESWEEDNSSSNDLHVRREVQVYTELQRYYQTARKILIQNREFLDKLAGALVERKTLIGKDVREIKKSCKIVA